ncbi:MAG: porin [Formosimonas sp.]
MNTDTAGMKKRKQRTLLDHFKLIMGIYIMKKSLLAAAILATVSGAASAATSVTLYGIVDAGYTTGSSETRTGTYLMGATPATVATVVGAHSSASTGTVTQEAPDVFYSRAAGSPSKTKTSNHVKQRDGYKDDSRIGVKGQEDLGNGLSAIFDVQMRFAVDEGSWNNKLGHSYVGLKGSFGEVTIGRRETITDDLFGYSSNAKELDLQVSDTWDNSLSYRGSFGGLTVGADVTTGENATGYTELSSGYKVVGGRTQQVSLGAEYSFGAGAVALGYDHSAAGKNAYALGLKYKVGPVEMFGRVSRSKQSVSDFLLSGLGDNMDKSIRATGFALGLNYNITSNDVFGLSYSQLNKKSNETLHSSLVRTNSFGETDVQEKSRMLSLDYIHSLSKRTSIYAGVSFDRTKTSSSYVNYTGGVANLTYILPSYTSKKTTAYTVGLKHSF